MLELRFAAATYSLWYDGQVPPPGLVILDSKAVHNAKFVGDTAWTLNYSRPAAHGTIPVAVGSEAGESARAPAHFAISESSREFDVDRPGVLAHEICHRHASRAFATASGRSGRLPDMLDEVAAISCESKTTKAERVRQFTTELRQGNVIPWKAFFATKHPLKDVNAVRTLTRLADPTAGAVTFEVRRGSPYGSKLAIFYAQAAAFGDFLEARSCRGVRALGQLLSTYDPRQGFDRWLSVHGARLCLPASIEAFERSFSKYIEEAARPLPIQARLRNDAPRQPFASFTRCASPPDKVRRCRPTLDVAEADFLEHRG